MSIELSINEPRDAQRLPPNPASRRGSEAQGARDRSKQGRANTTARCGCDSIEQVAWQIDQAVWRCSAGRLSRRCRRLRGSTWKLASTCSARLLGQSHVMNPTSDIEFFFDCSSPWTYLAFHNLQPM